MIIIVIDDDDYMTADLHNSIVCSTKTLNYCFTNSKMTSGWFFVINNYYRVRIKILLDLSQKFSIKRSKSPFDRIDSLEIRTKKNKM